MFFLCMAILCSVVWSTSYKTATDRGCRPLRILPPVGFCSLGAVLLLTGFFLTFSFHSTAAALGCTAGFCHYFAVLSFFFLIRRGARLGISWTVITLAMIVPTAVSVAVWREIPSKLQWIALILAVGGIVLLGTGRAGGIEARKMEKRDIILLGTAFLLSSGGLTLQKTLIGLDLGIYRGIYLISVYGTSFIISCIGCVIAGGFPSRRESLMGGLMGLGGAGNNWFLLLALSSLPGPVVFPFETCGSFILTILFAFAVFHEKISPRETAGLIVSFCALLLMSIG